MLSVIAGISQSVHGLLVGYGLDGPGFEYRQLPFNVQTTFGVHRASF